VSEARPIKLDWYALGWLIPLAFLAIPACDRVFGLQAIPPSQQNLKPGDPPLTSAVFCDIRDQAADPHCATPEDLVNGVRADQAALLLLKDKGSPVVLDYSDSARNALQCPAGVPVATYYLCDFPQGCNICINCGTIGTNHADPNAVCVAACEDRGAASHWSAPAAYCPANAHTSTNAPGCVDGVCREDGGTRPDFVDPRRTPAPVTWTDLVGVQATGTELNGLVKTAATTGFDSGAASVQAIAAHNAYAELTVTETSTARVLGLSTGGGADASPGLDDIAFGIRLTATGTIVLEENGAIVTRPDGSPFGTYQPGDRLRITVTERPDGQADIGYVLIPAGCAGTGCAGMALKPDASGPAPYPFRVDASLKDPGATLTDVRIVRTF